MLEASAYEQIIGRHGDELSVESRRRKRLHCVAEAAVRASYRASTPRITLFIFFR